MNDVVQKWAVGVLTAITVAVVAGIFGLWQTVGRLDDWHRTDWSLEKQLLLIEHAQLDARIQVNEANIEELEIEIERLE